MSDVDRLRLVDKARYDGRAYHKLHPGDYQFDPPVSPRPSKSVCDDRRVLLRAEAVELLRQGILKGMVSRPRADGLPKYIWAVDTAGEVYEAKIGSEDQALYHGYRLSEDDHHMRSDVLREWNSR